jgi:hypothetical protein
MDSIPEELKNRWAQRDSSEMLPVIATIDLTDHEPLPPDLDFLGWEEDDGNEPFPTIAAVDLTDNDPLPPELDFLEDTDKFFPENFPETLPPHHANSPWMDPLKLHGKLSVGPGTISIASYEPKRFSKTDHH